MKRFQFYGYPLHQTIHDEFFTCGEKSEDASAAAPLAAAPAAPPVAAAAAAPAPPPAALLSSRLKVRIELRRAQDERRRAILSAWACAHGLAEEASSSLLDLLLFYDTKLREEELPPVLLSPAKASGGAAASGAAASGAAFGGRSASSAAAAQLRKMIIDDSLAGYLAEPAARCTASSLRLPSASTRLSCDACSKRARQPTSRPTVLLQPPPPPPPAAPPRRAPSREPRGVTHPGVEPRFRRAGRLTGGERRGGGGCCYGRGQHTYHECRALPDGRNRRRCKWRRRKGRQRRRRKWWRKRRRRRQRHGDRQ